MEVIGIRLVTGEELLAQKVDTQPKKALAVLRPVRAHTVPGPNGIDVRLFPWTILADAEHVFVIGEASVVCSYPVPKDVSDNYIQTVSGIQIAQGPSLSTQLLQG